MENYGVIIGFIAGTVLLTYVTNGNTIEIIYLKEILVASIALLLVPNNVEINIEEFFSKEKCLPVAPKYTLEDSTNAIHKLNYVSDAIKEISDTYKEAAASVVTQEEIISQNKMLFIDELQNELESIEENFLYEEIAEENDAMLDPIFDLLNKKEKIEENDLVDIFEENQSYIVGMEDNNQIQTELKEMVDVINNSYKISKINFLWTKKVEENKKTISNQLDGVSKVISNIAEEIKPNSQENFEEEKEKIKTICKQKKIDILSVDIKQEKNKRYIAKVYINACKQDDDITCQISKIEKILTQVLKEQMTLQKENCAMKNQKEICMQTYVSKDKYTLSIGIAKKTKDKMSISGDSHIKAKLEDGKYLLAISDGMGSRARSKKKQSNSNKNGKTIVKNRL